MRIGVSMAESESAWNYCIESERAMLGSLMLATKYLHRLADFSTDWFWVPAHAKIYNAIKEAIEQGAKDNIFSVVFSLLASTGNLESVGGKDYIIQLAEAVPSPANCLAYSDIVRDRWVLRTAHARAATLATSCKAGELDKALALCESMASGLADPTDCVISVRDVKLNQAIDFASVPTGLSEIDSRIAHGGLPKGEYCTLIAPTGVGKTATAIQFALHAATLGKSVLYCTLEMSPEALKTRMLKSLSGFDRPPIGDLEEVALWEQAVELIADPYFDLSIADCRLHRTIESLTAKVEASASQKALDLVIIDYIQLLESTDRQYANQEASRYAHIGRQIMRSVARSRVACLCCSQAVLDDDGNLRTKGSRGFEEDSALLLIASPKGGNHLRIGKNRHGEGNVDLTHSWSKTMLRWQ